MDVTNHREGREAHDVRDEGNPITFFAIFAAFERFAISRRTQTALSGITVAPAYGTCSANCRMSHA